MITGDVLEGNATYMINDTTPKPPLYTFTEILEIGLRFLDQWNFPIIISAGNHRKLGANIQFLEGDMVFHGHEHQSGISYKNGVLWAKSHNAFEPMKVKPKTGFRVIQYLNMTHVSIDEEVYSYHVREPAKTISSEQEESREYFLNTSNNGFLSINLFEPMRFVAILLATVNKGRLI